MTLAAILLALVLFTALYRLGRLDEMHHGYLGVLLFAVPWRPLSVAGLVLLADDAIQHTVQCWYPAYLSPLHRAYGLVYARVAWIRRLNTWLDRVLS